ncbi:hypothetical protein GCM10020331_046220 [Ectobacillus funiculus]
MTVKPAEVFGLDSGHLQVGKKSRHYNRKLRKKEQEIDPATFVSKREKNTPFAGWKCKGWPVMTLVGGKIAWQKESVFA